MISFALDEEQQMLQATARRFAQEVLRPGQRAWEAARGIPDSITAAFHGLGLSLIDLPDLDTGAPPRMTSAVLVHEELAWGDPAAAVALCLPHFTGFGLLELGTPEQRARLLARFYQEAGPVRGAIAYSEGWKAPLAGFATQAMPTKDGYLLSGVKSFVLNAGHADLTLVFAQLEPDAGWDGFGVFAVDSAQRDQERSRAPSLGGPQPGLLPGARHRLLGLEAIPCAELILDGVLVPEQNRLRGPGAEVSAAGPPMTGGVRRGAARLFARGQLVTAARQVGLMRAAYECALEYTQDRLAFGKPVAHFQANAFNLSEMLMDLESSRWLVWRAAAAADHGGLDPALCAQAAVHASEAAWRVSDGCVQLLGGAGYIQDFPAEKWLRDTKALALFCGTPELEQQVLAAALLGHGADELPSCALQPVLT